jgi:thiazole/oxazole-forming peptide maturase SagC family component
LDVFYWHFGQTSQDAISKISSKSIALMGVNSISRRIALALQPLGIDCVKVVDFELLRNLSLFDSNGQLLDSEWPLAKPLDYQTWQEGLADDDLSCLVATSDFGGPQLMQEWNRFCVESDIYFLAVVLHRLVGTIGPFVIPRETACYECMRLRENSNMLDPGIERAAEDSAPERQAITGFHPSMLNVLGELAALELCKFYGGTSWRADHIIEVNLLVPSVVSRRVLKLPLCPVCSDAAKLSRTNIERGSPIPGNEPEEFDMR